MNIAEKFYNIEYDLVQSITSKESFIFVINNTFEIVEGSPRMPNISKLVDTLKRLQTPMFDKSA